MSPAVLVQTPASSAAESWRWAAQEKLLLVQGNSITMLVMLAQKYFKYVIKKSILTAVLQQRFYIYRSSDKESEKSFTRRLDALCGDRHTDLSRTII